VLIAALLVAWVLPASAHAADRLDIDGWLRKPNVRLLAVDFYSLDCGPCVRAMPDWRRLVDRYDPKGLRLLVVRNADDGRCPSLPWKPHRAFCDDEAGTLQKRFGVTGFPAAFLWNWRGELLVRNGAHVAEVRAAVQKHMKNESRALVLAGRGARAALIPQVRDELRRAGKFDVLAGPEDGPLFDKLRKKYSGLKYAGSDGRCDRLGQALPANAVIKVQVHGGRQRSLTLEMASLRGTCLGAGKAPWYPNRPGRSVAEAVSDLLDRLRLPELQWPVGRAASAAPVKERERRDRGMADWTPGAADLALVSFQSTPAGAMVMVDGKAACQTPCSKAVPAGSHRVAMHLPQYAARERTVRFVDKQRVRWRLEPEFALVSVRTRPEGVPIKLDGKLITAHDRHRVSAGAHVIEAGDSCHASHNKTVVFKRGERREVVLRPAQRPAAVLVAARAAHGDVRASVYVDGRKVGTTFNTLKVPMCSRILEVRHPAHGRVRKALSLRERKLTRIDLRFPVAARKARVPVRRTPVRRAPPRSKRKDASSWRNPDTWDENQKNEDSGPSYWDMPAWWGTFVLRLEYGSGGFGTRPETDGLGDPKSDSLNFQSNTLSFEIWRSFAFIPTDGPITIGGTTCGFQVVSPLNDPAADVGTVGSMFAGLPIGVAVRLSRLVVYAEYSWLTHLAMGTPLTGVGAILVLGGHDYKRGLPFLVPALSARCTWASARTQEPYNRDPYDILGSGFCGVGLLWGGGLFSNR